MYVLINGRGEIETTYTEDELAQAERDVDDCRSVMGDNSCYIAEVMLVNGEYLAGGRVYPRE